MYKIIRGSFASLLNALSLEVVLTYVDRERFLREKFLHVIVNIVLLNHDTYSVTNIFVFTNIILRFILSHCLFRWVTG